MWYRTREFWNLTLLWCRLKSPEVDPFFGILPVPWVTATTYWAQNVFNFTFEANGRTLNFVGLRKMLNFLFLVLGEWSLLVPNRFSTAVSGLLATDWGNRSRRCSWNQHVPEICSSDWELPLIDATCHPPPSSKQCLFPFGLVLPIWVLLWDGVGRVA